MKAYHRVDPLMDERKSHYTPAQLGAFLKVQLVAGRQSKPGYFRSLDALKRSLPADYVKLLAFLIDQGDLIERDGQIYVDGWEEWQDGDLTVGERMARLRNRRRNADRNDAVTPSVTSAVYKPSPAAIGVGVGISVGSGSTRSSRPLSVKRAPASVMPDVRFTKEQFDGWASFGPEWDFFKAAWLARGFLFPPAGSPEDDDTSQRGLLYQVLDAWPMEIARWVSEAPKGRTARQVIDHVLAQWHAVRESVGEDEPDSPSTPMDRTHATERLGEIMARVIPKVPA